MNNSFKAGHNLRHCRFQSFILRMRKTRPKKVHSDLSKIIESGSCSMIPQEVELTCCAVNKYLRENKYQKKKKAMNIDV